MKRIELITGYKCNTPCLFCTSGNNTSCNASPGELISILNNYRESGAEGIIFGGGEPAVHPGIIYLIEAAAEMGYSEIEIKTNGVRFCYPEFVEACLAAGARRFSVSLWGHNAETHDWMAGRPGAFEMTEMGIKHLIHFGADVKIDFLQSTLTCGHEVEALSGFWELGVEKMDVWLLSLFGSGGWGRELVPTMTNAGNAIVQLADAAAANGCRVRTSHVPPCLLDDRSELYFNVRYLNLRIVVTGEHSFMAEESPFEKGRYIPKCRDCQFKETCSGPRIEYIEEFGYSDFNTI